MEDMELEAKKGMLLNLIMKMKKIMMDGKADEPVNVAEEIEEGEPEAETMDGAQIPPIEGQEGEEDPYGLKGFMKKPKPKAGVSRVIVAGPKKFPAPPTSKKSMKYG